MATFTPPKDPRRQYIGMVNQAKGKDWEKIIERSCTYYRDKGIADIEKTPEPMKILRDLGGGRFIACFEKAAQADYQILFLFQGLLHLLLKMKTFLKKHL